MIKGRTFSPRSIALRITVDAGVEAARMLIVFGCAAALALAGFLQI